MGTDWLATIEKKRKLLFRIKLAVAIIITVLVIGFVGFYINATTPSFYGPGPIEITISPNKPYFLEGENVTFTITVINNQSWPVTYPLSEKVNIQKDGVEYEGSGLQIDYPIKIPTFPAKASTPLSWTWFESNKGNQTIPHQRGNYSISFYISGVDYSAVAYCTFEVR